MYDLSMSLNYQEPLVLQGKYIYNFICIDLEPTYGSIFVFRTIKYGDGKDNVLIDLIDYRNLNAFDVALHKDCTIHILKKQKLFEYKSLKITDNITLEVIFNNSNYEFYAILKEQKYKCRYGKLGEVKEEKHFPSIKYLLFTMYKEKERENIMNVNSIELADIFKLQEELIWNNNRYHNYNDLTKITIDKLVNNKTGQSSAWNEIKTIIKTERVGWDKKMSEKFNQFLLKSSLQEYVPIE